jgi:hypothetical protein
VEVRVWSHVAVLRGSHAIGAAIKGATRIGATFCKNVENKMKLE